MKLLLIAAVALATLIMVSCEDASLHPEGGQNRFDKIGTYNVEGENCLVRVMRDNTTGCEYLLVCNAVTAMPNTCTNQLHGGDIQ